MFVAMGAMKVIGAAKEIYTLRRWLVAKGVFSYTPPDARAIRECPECDYCGVLAIDKHRPAPMSDINWELRCPDCRHTIEGPMHAEDVGEYVNLARDSDVMGAMVEVGNYGAFQVVTTHNAQYALSREQIEGLREAKESSDDGE